jgi:phospholipase C
MAGRVSVAAACQHRQEALVAAHGRWRSMPVRVIALLTAMVAGLFGLGMASSAGAQAPQIRSPIQHVVVLYLENHTFDSLLGYWCNDHPGRCPDGGMPAKVILSNGTVVTPAVSPDKVPTVLHTVQAQEAAIDHGRMDGWQNVPGCQASNHYACISGYTPSQIPNLTALADSFAISDRTFSMANSPSWGGHLYAVMASLDGFEGNNPVPLKGVQAGPGWGCDSNKVTQWVSARGAVQFVPSCIPDFSLGLQNGGAFEPTPASYAPTILDRLDSAHLSWRIYGEPQPLTGGSQSPGYIWDVCPSFAECLHTGQKASNVPSSSFVQDAQHGKLPSFSIITPGGKDAPFSEHNGTSMTAGDDWLGQIASAVMNGPEWRSTALFITWDDCGCFYDQVQPAVNPDGTAQGPRSPLVIVSPFAKPGFTDTNAATFAGILRFTELNFGLSPLGPNDGQAYSFSNAFNFRQAPLRPVHMIYRKWPRDAYHINMTATRDGT